MNFKLTLSLVIVLLVIAISLFFIPAKVATVKDTKTATPLLSPKPAGVKAITFTRNGEKQVAFSRSDKGWEMTFPMQGVAESWQVDSIADALTGLAYKEQFQPEATGNHSPQTTGMEHPKALIAFTDDAGKEHTLALGKRTVGGVYATLDGGKTVYLLEHDPQESLDKPPQDFRDKAIKEVATDKVAELTIAHGDEAPVTLGKSGEKWLINKPLSARADQAKVQEILDELKTIRASGFTQMPRDSAATGLNPPVLSVTAMISEPAAAPASAPATAPTTAVAPAPKLTPVTLQLGYYTGLSDKKNVYASLAGSKEVFTFSADSFNKLNKQLSDLRDAAVTPAMAGAATEATLSTGGKVVLKVARKDAAWMFENTAAPMKAGEMEVGDWLGDIRNLRAIRFVDNAGDLKSIGLDPPQSRIELAIPGQSQHEVIFIGKPETDVGGGNVTPMMRQGEPTVYLVQSADAQKVVPTMLTLRDRAVERLSSDRIRTIKISGSAVGGGGLDLQREGASWNVTAPPKGGKSAKADDEKITALLAEFTPLTAAKYLAEKADVAGTPDVTVVLTVFEPVPPRPSPSATGPATRAAAPSTAPGSATAPAATSPGAPAVPTLGPELSKPVERTLKLYKTTADNKTQWKALWDGAAPQWTFEPTAALVEHVTTETYLPAPTTTQAATQK